MIIISKLIGVGIILISIYMIKLEITDSRERVERHEKWWDALIITHVAGGVFGLICGGILLFTEVTIWDMIEAF